MLAYLGAMTWVFLMSIYHAHLAVEGRPKTVTAAKFGQAVFASTARILINRVASPFQPDQLTEEGVLLRDPHAGRIVLE